MSVDILMPALSPTMEEGTLSKWLKKEGDKVESGDIIAEIETDKATIEVEAVDEGTLAKILIPEGTEGVKVNAVIALLAEEGEDASNVSASQPASNGSAPQTKAPEPAPEPAAATMGHNSAKLIDPDVPDGASFTDTAVRDALRDAMAEEMRRDDKVLVMIMAAHFEIHVGDVAEAKRFYGGLFGWSFSPMPGGEAVSYHLIEGAPFQAGLTAGLMQRMGDAPAAGAPIRGGTMTFDVADCDERYAWALANGGSEALPPEDYPGIGRCAYVDDGQGNVVGMITPSEGDA